MSRADSDQIGQQYVMCWPTRAAVWLYLQIILALNILFVIVYGGANQLASLRGDPYHFFAEWELNIPFVPAMIYVYFSISLLFLAPLFVLNATRLKRLGIAAALCIIFAGLSFILIPGTTGFAPTCIVQPTSAFESWVFEILHRIDKPYNTVPSLHVGLSTLVVLSTRHGSTSRLLSNSLFLWLFIIMLSVVFVHQHHIVDVATGWILGYGCHLYYRRAKHSVS